MAACHSDVASPDQAAAVQQEKLVPLTIQR